MTKVEDVVRVTVTPWEGERGIVENVNGACNTIRLDSSQHPEDVQELYPTEFVVLCQGCEHDPHKPGKCEVLHVYARGPNDPPGNQGCLCGIKLDAVITNTNTNEGWTSSQFYTDDWDDKPDVPLDNFFWKDGDFKVKLDTTAFGIFVNSSEGLHIEVPDISAGLREMADILEKHYQKTRPQTGSEVMRQPTPPPQVQEEKTLQQKLAEVARDTCKAHKGAHACCYVVNLAVTTAIEEYTE